MQAIKATNRGRRFYEAYKLLTALRDVKRVGFILANSFGPEEQKELKKKGGAWFKNRVHSDQEHCDGCKNVIILLDMIYPEILKSTEEEIEDYGYDRFRLLIRGMMEHELGEIPSGDIASDGTRNEEEKDREELEFVSAWSSKCFDPTIAILNVRIFEEMQLKSTEIGMLLFWIDKIEAVLFNLILEEYGQTGFVTAKPDITDLDKNAMELTNDPRCADVWLCNTLVTNPKLLKFRFTPIFLEIVQSFALAIRGKEMAWIDRVVAKLEARNAGPVPGISPA